MNKIINIDDIPAEIFTAAIKLREYAARQGWKDWLFMGIAERAYTERLLAERDALASAIGHPPSAIPAQEGK